MLSNKFSEVGVLVKSYPENRLVVHWMVQKKAIASSDNDLYGWKKGDPVYMTSMGWVGGLLDHSDYFRPTPRERSLSPTMSRALDSSKNKWPEWRVEIH